MKHRGMAFFAAILMAVTIVCMPAAAAGSSDNAVKEARNGVVRILTVMEQTLYDADGNFVTSGSAYASGSGFGVGAAGKETNVFVTNRHVVSVEDEVLKNSKGELFYAQYQITGYYILLDSYAYNTASYTLDPSRAIPCTVVYIGKDDDEDVAVLKAANPVSGRVALSLLGDEDSLEITDSVSSLGYPGSTDRATSEGYLLADLGDMVVNPGAVSRFYDSESAVGDNSGVISGHLIQHTATINHGNSGGPLVNANGAVVGINTYGVGQNTSTGDVNSYYALRIKYAKDALDSLNISYDVYAVKSGTGMTMIIIIVAAVVVIIAAMAVILLQKKKIAFGGKPSAQSAQSQPAQSQPVQQRAMLRSMAAQHNGLVLAVGSTPILIGRDSANCKLVYAEGTAGVSGRHCSVSYDAAAGEFILTDLRSTYGTFLIGGQKLDVNVPHRLKPGESFYVGDRANVLRVELG